MIDFNKVSTEAKLKLLDVLLKTSNATIYTSRDNNLPHPHDVFGNICETYGLIAIIRIHNPSDPSPQYRIMLTDGELYQLVHTYNFERYHLTPIK